MGESKCGTGGKRTWRQKHHSKGIGPLKKGVLSSTGYSVKNSLAKRHRSLNRLVKKEGALKAFRQLNAVAVYDKNSAPTKSRTFKRDRNWVRRKFMKGGGVKEDALQLLKTTGLVTGFTDEELDAFVFKSGKMKEAEPYKIGEYEYFKKRSGTRGWKLDVRKDGVFTTLHNFVEY